jgi:hypothetical protein
MFYELLIRVVAVVVILSFVISFTYLGKKDKQTPLKNSFILSSMLSSPKNNNFFFSGEIFHLKIHEQFEYK